MMSKYRRQVMDDAAQLSELGIVIESGQVVFSGNPGAEFDCPFDMAVYLQTRKPHKTIINQNTAEICFADSETTCVDDGQVRST